jgi:lysylphosphatidylglycerol synthetase-like protein (DUF2156 family)
MAVNVARPGYELWRPNREKAENKTMKALVALVFLISAALLVIITLGGWSRLQSQSVGVMTLAWAGLYVLFAFLVMRWNRGILPVAAALAIIMAIFAAIAAPHWFARDKVGLSAPALPEDLLGLLTVIVVAVQLVLVAVAMVAFAQEWHVEEERPIPGGQADVPAAYQDDHDAVPANRPEVAGEYEADAAVDQEPPPGGQDVDPPPDAETRSVS